MRLILPFSDFISIFFGRQQLFHAAYIVLTHVPNEIRRVCQTAANASHTGKQATISDSSDQSKWKYPGRSWNIFLSDIPNDSPTFLWFSNVNWNKLPCKNTRKWLWSYCSPIGQNNTRVFFLLNQEPAFAESLGNGLERLVSQGLLYFYRKLSSLRFLPGLLRFAST